MVSSFVLSLADSDHSDGIHLLSIPFPMPGLADRLFPGAPASALRLGLHQLLCSHHPALEDHHRAAVLATLLPSSLLGRKVLLDDPPAPSLLLPSGAHWEYSSHPQIMLGSLLLHSDLFRSQILFLSILQGPFVDVLSFMAGRLCQAPRAHWGCVMG